MSSCAGFFSFVKVALRTTWSWKDHVNTTIQGQLFPFTFISISFSDSELFRAVYKNSYSAILQVSQKQGPAGPKVLRNLYVERTLFGSGGIAVGKVTAKTRPKLELTACSHTHTHKNVELERHEAIFLRSIFLTEFSIFADCFPLWKLTAIKFIVLIVNQSVSVRLDLHCSEGPKLWNMVVVDQKNKRTSYLSVKILCKHCGERSATINGLFVGSWTRVSTGCCWRREMRRYRFRELERSLSDWRECVV